MTKEKKVYYLLVVSFILFISVFVSIYLIRKINYEGKIIIKRKYYDIVYLTNNDNIIIQSDVINIKLNNIEEEPYFDIINTGNIDAKVKNVDVNIINTNIDKDSLSIKLNFNRGDYIKGGETKRVYIDLDNLLEEQYLDLKIKYTFGE